MFVNDIDNKKFIRLEIERDLKNIRKHHMYPASKILTLEQKFLKALENEKNYYKRDYAKEKKEYYSDLLKEVVLKIEENNAYTFIEKYEKLIGTYMLLSYIESPLYYLEKIDLHEYLVEDILHLSDIILQIPQEYLSVLCPILSLPQVHSKITENRKVTKRTFKEEMNDFITHFIHYIETYSAVSSKEIDKNILRKKEQVDAIIDITNERGSTFLHSKNENELIWNNMEDKPKALSLINEILDNQQKEYQHEKVFVKKNKK